MPPKRLLRVFICMAWCYPARLFLTLAYNRFVNLSPGKEKNLNFYPAIAIAEQLVRTFVLIPRSQKLTDVSYKHCKHCLKCCCFSARGSWPRLITAAVILGLPTKLSAGLEIILT